MADDADDFYRAPTWEEAAELPEYWWHKWLIDPIMQGDLPAIRRYLAHKPESLHTEDPWYYDPFIVAAKQPDPGALRLLLDHWAVHPTPDASPPNERGDLLLNVACAHGALETARYLLDEQPALADIHGIWQQGCTPILEAAASLLTCAKDEQFATTTGRTFDAQAARERVHRSEALVNLLLDRGARATDRESSDNGDTVLSLAVARGGPALLRRLIDGGADVFATTGSGLPSSKDVTLMHVAALYGNYAAIEILVEYYALHGRDRKGALACRDSLGRLPIHYAVANWPKAPSTTTTDTDVDADTDTAALLRVLTDGGDPHLSNAQDQDGETPLLYAVSRVILTYRPAVAVVRFYCADLHATAAVHGRDGETPLHRLCCADPNDVPGSFDTGLAALLLDLDLDSAAEINALDNAGNTPLHFAARWLAEVPGAQFLLGRGADVRIRNKKGETPLHEAAKKHHEIDQLGATVEDSIRAQNAMLAALCGSTDKEAVLENSHSALLDEADADGKTPRQIAEETRAAWREEEAAERARLCDFKMPRGGCRGRGRGRGRGGKA